MRDKGIAIIFAYAFSILHKDGFCLGETMNQKARRKRQVKKRRTQTNCPQATEIFYSDWVDLALAITSTRVNPLECSTLTFKIVPGTVMEAVPLNLTFKPSPSPSTIIPSASPTITTQKPSKNAAISNPPSKKPTISKPPSQKPALSNPSYSKRPTNPPTLGSYSYFYGKFSSGNRDLSQEDFFIPSIDQDDLMKIIAEEAAERRKKKEIERQAHSTISPWLKQMPAPRTYPSSKVDIDAILASKSDSKHKLSSQINSFASLSSRQNDVSEIDLGIDDDIVSLTAIPINPFTNILFPDTYSQSDKVEFKIIVQCGETGIEQQPCIVTGGDSHFFLHIEPKIDDDQESKTKFLSLSMIQIQFKGITMEKAMDTSILVYHDLKELEANEDGPANSLDINFDSCVWSENQGNFGAAIDIYQIPSTTSPVTSSIPQLKIEISSSTFLSNKSDYGAVLVESDPSAKRPVSVIIRTSLFQANKEGGAVQSRLESASSNTSFDNLAIELRDNCFVKNVNIARQGTISLEILQSSVIEQSGNYGSGNSVTDPNGFAIDDDYEYTESSLCLDISTFVNASNPVETSCLKFSASDPVSSCNLIDTLPTASPTKPPGPTPSPPAPLCTDGKTQGYSSWGDLTDAVKGSRGNQTIVLCPNTVFDPNEFASDDVIIVPDTAILIEDKQDLTFQCGNGTLDQNCTIRSGETHFWFQGEVGNIDFQGIRFEEADQSSILAYASSSSTATFTDCSWKRNEGEYGSVVNLWNDIPGERMTVRFRNCEFHNNTSVQGTLVAEGGTLEVESCNFRENSDGAIYVQNGGRLLSLIGCCFENNPYSDAVVTIESDSSLGIAENNFGIDNNLMPGEASNCSDIRVGDNCLDFDSNICLIGAPTAAPTRSASPSSSAAPTRSLCFDTWNDLKTAISTHEQSAESNAVELYRLCSNATLTVPSGDNGITIDRSNINIACGSNDCTIEGGSTIINIQSESSALTGIQVRGITFSGATQGAVLAGARTGSSATFSDCSFRNIAGSSLATIVLSNTQGLGMEVSLENCTFANNTAGIAIIQNIGGRLILRSTTFEDNIAGNVLSISGGGSLSMSKNCFTDNQQRPGLGGFGLISVRASGELVDNTDNFGSNNVLFPPTGESCDIYIEADDVCEPFDGMDCLAGDK